MSNSFNPDQALQFVRPIWVQTACKSYQTMTIACKDLTLCLLVSSAKNVGPDLDPDCLTRWWYFSKNVNFEKNHMTKKHEKFPRGQIVKWQCLNGAHSCYLILCNRIYHSIKFQVWIYLEYLTTDYKVQI